MIIKDKAKEYLKTGLSVIPTKADKRPNLPTWKPYQTERIKEDEVENLFSSESVKGLGIICGAISGGLEVIDVDTKHDTTGTLWKELKALLEDNLPIYKSLVIAQTISGGYHIYYRCSVIEGNLKLSTKKNREVLIETRGEGGYVIAPPSKGYKYIQGELSNIPTITYKEREIIFNIGRSFNEIAEPEPKVNYPTSTTTYKTTGLTPFEDYNNRGDVIGLLQSKGWKVTNETGQRVNLLRPGQTDSKTSGNFHTGLKVLRVFSSSTEFSPDKGYSSSQVYSLLECNEDNKLTYARLLELGYGEPYNSDKIATTQVKTEQIKVEVVNKVNSITSVISSPGESLKIENIKTALGDEIVITSPSPEAMDEVIKAIDLIEGINNKLYVKEGATEVKAYRYKLQYLFNKYGKLEQIKEGLTDRDIDSFLDEVVLTAHNLSPIDKDIFLKEFLEVEDIKKLGITGESLAITVDRLTSTRDKEAQATNLKNLLSKATNLQTKGDVDKALDLITTGVKDVQLKDKATEFSSLMKPIKEDELKQRIAITPESVNSGLTIGGEELLLPAGAISVFTAPTSHGKTTFLINLALNVAKEYKDKETYLFSYEEDGDSILSNALNTYLDSDIGNNNRRVLKTYFTTDSTEHIREDSKEYFTATKDKFFKELIDAKRLNIHYSNYTSDTLIEAIRYLHKNANPGSIFIDYMQLLNLPQGKYKTYSRQEEMKQICIALKDVAVETGLPIILGAQFNREVTNHLRIHSTKIGEAGDIERIANLIVGFWNNNFKPLATEPEQKELNEKGCTEQGTIYATILKNRGGIVGGEELFSFNGNTGKISNTSKQSSNPF